MSQGSIRDMADKSVQFDGCTQDSRNARPLGRRSPLPFLKTFFMVIADAPAPEKSPGKRLKTFHPARSTSP